MRTTRSTTIIVVGGALAIASVGYGLGTQAGGGTAIAGDGSGDTRDCGPGVFFKHGPGPAFEGLAKTLGVDKDRLARALKDFHQDEHAGVRKTLRERGSLAEARRDVEKRWERHRQELARFLADRFDIDVDKVADALPEFPKPVPPPHGGRPGPGGPGAFGLVL